MLLKPADNTLQFASPENDDSEWGKRANFWRNYRTPAPHGRPRKFKYREPIILCGHGVKLRVDHRTLLIRNGFTHYPHEPEIFRFFPGDPNLPDRIVLLDGSGGISFDALTWMADQNIDFVKLDWRGEVSSFGGISGYSANPKLVKIQREIIGSKKQIEIARRLISEKVSASISTLLRVIPKSENRENAISSLEKHLSELRSVRGTNSIPTILGHEGGSAAAYFRAWQGIRLYWTGTGRKPIPDSWREIGPRTMGWRNCMRNARHPINAMLNYGYGILKFQIRAQVVAAGLDPSVGILHGNSQNRTPFVYDFMEPLRPLVDRQILQFALAHTFAPGDFTINKWGGCRLNPQLARVVAKQVTDVKSHHIVKAFTNARE